MNDLTDRLRAANPVTEEPALPPIEPLLARLSDETPRPRRSRRRLLIPALVMTVLVAVVVGLELRGPNVDVVAEARAALGGPGGIVHVIARDERFNPDGTLVDRSGTTSEIWSASDPLRFRVHDAGFEAAYFDGVVTTREDGEGLVHTARREGAARDRGHRQQHRAVAAWARSPPGHPAAARRGQAQARRLDRAGRSQGAAARRNRARSRR